MGYVPNAALMRSSYRNSKQYPTINSNQSVPSYVINESSWDPHHHNGQLDAECGAQSDANREYNLMRVTHSCPVTNRAPSSAICPPAVGADSSAGGGLYNIARQRASHEFPIHSDDLEVIGLRRLTGADLERLSSPQSPPQDPTPNTSGDFEWDFGEENTPATRRLDHLVNHRWIFRYK